MNVPDSNIKRHKLRRNAFWLVIATILLCLTGLTAVVWNVNEFAPLFLNSRIERLGEKGLPRITIEGDGSVYCRMKADDFRFPLPPGSRGENPVITRGGFDTVDGRVFARFRGSNLVTAAEYEKWLSGRLQRGSRVSASPAKGGLLIEFHYFGDK